MADYAPAWVDGEPNAVFASSDKDGTLKPSAPSEFLTHLPPSNERTFNHQLQKPMAVAETTASNGDTMLLTTARSQVDTPSSTLNSRSCMHCRKRKVKCEKPYPCSNCKKAHVECVFPAPGRAPRKVRKAGKGIDKGLLERLSRLEAVMKGMGMEVPVEISEHFDDTENRTEQDASQDADTPNSSRSLSNGETKSMMQRSDLLENRFSQLIVNEGKSRYINNSFWATLSNEVNDLKGMLNQSSGEEETEGSQGYATSEQQAWVFGFSSQNVDLLSLHPANTRIQAYWETYKDRVDPMVKVLHIPTFEPTILNAARNMNNLPKALEALMFAIYYGATTSLTAADCAAEFGEEQGLLLARYRFALEQALARANFLTTEEFAVLQAFVIFLVCMRRNSDPRLIWTLTGHVARIAQTIGIHRDGSHFGLSPFDIQMRRRLWWQVCILDIRASEDHGCDPTVIEQAFDTQMPLNINDADMNPEMKDNPRERQGCTEMSYCCIRFEVANLFRRLMSPCKNSSFDLVNSTIEPQNSAFDTRRCRESCYSTLQDKETWIMECHQRIEERYLKQCDMSVPLFWVTATAARLIMSKTWLLVYHISQRQEGGLPSEARDKLFIASLQNVEYSLLLETESRTMKWGWLFQTYVQWHALAFMLSELCHRLKGDLVERAWIAVQKSRGDRWGENAKAQHLWGPLNTLYRKALEARNNGLERTHVEHDGRLSMTTSLPSQSVSVSHSEERQQQNLTVDESLGSTYATTETDGDLLGSQPVAANSSNGLPPPVVDAPNSHQNPNFRHTFIPDDTLGDSSRPSSKAMNDLSFDVGMSAMDTDMNWENWDQLVRDFGMDFDSSGNSMKGPGSRMMGMGMGGGDWF